MASITETLKAEAARRSLRYVGTRGNTKSPVCCVGEAPGADEEREGFPFVGASGKELDRMIAEGGLRPSDVWFTNPYKIRPPENDLRRLPELGIPTKLFEDQFFEELNETKPTIILASGSTSLRLLCPETISRRDGTVKISQWRGSLLRSPHLGWEHYVLAVYHPAFILREWSERQLSVFCYARASEELAYYRTHGRLQPLPERQLLVEPPADTVIDYLREILQSPHPTSVDIEMIKYAIPYTISFAKSPVDGISFSLWDYPVDKLRHIWRLIDTITRTKAQIGQNYLGFDAYWLEYLSFGVSPRLVEDTMVRDHVLWPEFEHKLQHLCFRYTREPYYKDEGKGWKPSEKKRLMRYNALDTTVTYEIYEAQQKEFLERPALKHFYEGYERRLYHVLHTAEQRGVAVDTDRLSALRRTVLQELDKTTSSVGAIVKRDVFPSKEFAKAKGFKKEKTYFNLSSGKQVLGELKRLGLKIPTVYDYKLKKSKETSGESALNTLYAETNAPILKHILRSRELCKLLGTYIDIKLRDSADGLHELVCQYAVTGTVTGRRSSRKVILGYGTNLQNLPKHPSLDEMLLPPEQRLFERYRECLVARPEKLLISADQVQAEDWMIQGIIADVSGDRRGLDELLGNVDRHRKLAAFLFSKPEAECGKDTPARFFGKKTRYAGSYDMKDQRFAEAFAAEGYAVTRAHCAFLLDRFHQFDPGIKQVFHRYVQEQLSKTRTLRTPLGRERVFFGLRSFNDNSKIFKEGYAYIPQSTIGDNTGLAICYIEKEWPVLLMDGHDAVTLEVEDTDDSILRALRLLKNAFNREIVFLNGLRVTIPIEYELGYNLKDTLKCPNTSETSFIATLQTWQNKRVLRSTIITGAPSPQLQPA